MTVTNDPDKLLPRRVWAHFATLCGFTRPALHETPLHEHLIDVTIMIGIANGLNDADIPIRKICANLARHGELSGKRSRDFSAMIPLARYA